MHTGSADMEAARVSIGMAFDLLDENSDGRLSRLEVLKGLKTKPRVRELLQMGAFTDPAEFDAVYKAIDTDGSNNVDRREFESYFMRRLAGGAGGAYPPQSPAGYQQQQYPPHSYGYPPPGYPQQPPYPYGAGPSGAGYRGGPQGETQKERELKMAAGAALKFAQAGRDNASRRDAADAQARIADAAAATGLGNAAALNYPHLYGGSELLSGSSSVALLNAEASDLAAYDEVARSLEMSQRRRIGLQQDLETLQREMRQVEADIVAKSANAERLRQSLTRNRQAHTTVVSQIDSRLKQLDREQLLASRPHLRTADRPS